MSLLGKLKQKFRRWVENRIPVKLISLFVVGEKVKDDLTREEHIIIGISYMNGYCGDKKTSHYHCWGIWIDSDYAGGARHPWELTKL